MTPQTRNTDDIQQLTRQLSRRADPGTKVTLPIASSAATAAMTSNMIELYSIRDVARIFALLLADPTRAVRSAI